ncbi:hypothetical protein [Microtetraspora sp. NBRC 16547]|uniref:hypothetical protein n=1 Tax=Microtetraspora sp. NBRC 16547 TaxID=3030993 RepID=UPI0024A06F41|nr:hypothetical protein [Microtetraspora sp. NBRC 16547]GLX01094.1 hypothetical protein Misp02_51800 [Microtetraspora sp. NBRC 16547]
MTLRPSWWGLAGTIAIVLLSQPATGWNPLTVTSAQRISYANALRISYAVLPVRLPPTWTLATAPGGTAVTAMSATARLAHTGALQQLRGAGLRWRSSGGCVDRTKPTCTSLEGLRYGTLTQAIELKRRSDCRIVITGGTEVGHSAGRYSHKNGFKIDIAHNPCIDAYVTKTFGYWTTRGDGARMYRPETGRDVYADEANHWDILFR